MKKYNIPQKITALIFDLDGTLYTNAEYLHEQIDAQVRYFAKLRGISADEARGMVAAARRSFAQRNGGKKISLGNVLAQFGIPLSENIKWREMLTKPENFLAKDERLSAYLRALAKKYTLICVTNNPSAVGQKSLAVLGVEQFFTKVIGLDTCGVSKPAREPFVLAAEIARAECANCVAVGDRFDIDVALPLELGMGGVVVDGVEDVYRLADELLAAAGEK